MLKVLLAVPNSTGWVGGLNYFKGLVNAYNSLPEKKIELFIISNGDLLPPPLNELKKISDVSFPSGSDPLPRKIARRLRRFFQGQDILVEKLKGEGIRLFSHGYFLGKASPIPALRWIPDFQDRYLPHFFSKKELISRKYEQKLMVENKEPILFSSQTAREDFNRFYPGHKCPTYILNFVGLPSPAPGEESMRKILTEYQIQEPFFYVPNQVWAHKNHKIIIEALKVVQLKNPIPLVICSGHVEDYRNPNFFKGLQDLLESTHLENRMRFLGLIQDEAVSTLMRKCVATINPSLFEGWSTTVEESKSLGKRVILSDIPVHREQNPARSIYFEPHDAFKLADAMETVLRTFDESSEAEAMSLAETQLSKRVKKFAEDYESIVLDVILRSHTKT